MNMENMSVQQIEDPEWFQVRGDLDDFIFYDPCGCRPEDSER